MGAIPIFLLASTALSWNCCVCVAQSTEPPGISKLPPQSVFVEPLSFAVLGPNGTFHNDTFSPTGSFFNFNPTGTKPPFFQIFDKAFLDILGPNPTFNEIASNATFGFAQEAPIYFAETDEMFFANANGPPGVLTNSDINHNNGVGKISLKAVEAALAKLGPNQVGAAVNVPVTELDLPDSVQMTNGGTGPFHGNLVLATSGRGPLPSSVVLVNPRPPFNATVLLDNYFGRQFNALDDVKIHPKSGGIFITDPGYGFLLKFRFAPTMPNQVYRFDPATGNVRVVATDFVRPNGVAFTPDGTIAYVTDTGALSNVADPTLPATIYAYDVHPTTEVFLNRRVFAYADSGIPDGIQVDAKGNVYAGCGDGTNVWSPDGILLGKFFIGQTSANMAFAGDGRLVIVAETKMFLAKIAAKEGKVTFP
ncbi:hypothetical protein D9619_008111 [Psilocybe cf. subviscida]|uniref:SMP-30/Gluconolactonase/LRE-like region domain-containing protein n=1 Tax=Psilocybe cf. subviscida TaxID=2480587 RepID=A0A8H5AU90_9AGAR|nr:hypothetical protein D9619_008111 [Psilocybe cf. subviscida]